MSLAVLIKKAPMFSQGQIAFGVLFFIVFAIIIYFMYRKDLQLHLKNFKGVKWILVGFLGFFILLLCIKFLLSAN